MRGVARRLHARHSSHSALASWLRPSARTATYVERAAEGDNEADGPFSAACLVQVLAEKTQDGLVEGGSLLEEVHVARLGNTDELGAGDALVEIVRGGRRHQDVLGARGDEGGHAELAQPITGVVAADGLSLPVQSDEGRLERILEGSLDPHLDEVAPLREGLPAEEPGQHEEGELLHAAAGLGAQKV